MSFTKRPIRVKLNFGKFTIKSDFTSLNFSQALILGKLFEILFSQFSQMIRPHHPYPMDPYNAHPMGPFSMHSPFPGKFFILNFT